MLSMSDESDDPKFEPEFKPEDPKLFDMNRIVRLGRSRDQVLTTVTVPLVRLLLL